MNQAPTSDEIYAAELRVMQARQRTRASLQRARTSLRAQLARPQTLIAVAVTTGFFGYWLMRRSRSQPATPAAGPATRTSLAGLLLAFLMRYGRPALPFLVRQARAAWQQRALRASIAATRPSARSQSAARSYPPAGTLH